MATIVWSSAANNIPNMITAMTALRARRPTSTRSTTATSHGDDKRPTPPPLADAQPTRATPTVVPR
ncbi:hypothetical protein GCM10010492_02020 [Saccharothrix mutabilis subsp. mutabilis]|uniref:Uncharacterized protein n=1 Tax=Saccharothrix mutabilis subsp. mutabilis TaxID=66855 RepID=A0ABN0T059_9PSEU